MNYPFKTSVLRYVRPGYALLVLLLSLLAIFEAPTRLLWLAAVVVTEYGHFLALFSLLVFLPGWRNSRRGRFSAGAGLLAAVLALTPLVRALPVQKRLPSQFHQAFPQKSANNALAARPPLDFRDLWRGVSFPVVASTRLIYQNRPEGPLTLDLYQAEAAGTGRPVVVVIHGGGWNSGDSKELPDLNSYLAHRGYAVAAVNYRLAPHWRYPAPLADVQAAIAYLKEHATEFSLDPGRIFLLGRSAGAHLALQAAYTLNDPGIRGVVSFYGPADLYFGYVNPANPLVIDSKKVLEDFLGGSPDEVADLYHSASPIQHVGQGTPPTLLIHGGRDELVFPAQSRRLAAKLNENGVPHLYLELPWATHGCDFNISGPAGQLSLYAIERFLGALY